MKIMILFGTRPEVIKLAPLIRELRNGHASAGVVVVSTGQHRDSTRELSEFFDLRTDHDLDIMQTRQTLAHILTEVVRRLDPLLERERPDVLIVQGDTTSSMAASLAATLRGIRVGHVEAGLRTTDKFLPFPEECNRRVTGALADWHFAPTERALRNLLGEGKPKQTVFLTGNTVIDAMEWILESRPDPDPASLPPLEPGTREILVTIHRRESFGAPILRACSVIREITEEHPDVSILFPVHWNPSVRESVHESLGGRGRIRLVEPLSYVDFLAALQRCHFVMTDSGGVQEEAPSLGKPVLILREETERPEAIECGAAWLVGTDAARIAGAARRLLRDQDLYSSMATRRSPFGDGLASRRIAGILLGEMDPVSPLPWRRESRAAFVPSHADATV